MKRKFKSIVILTGAGISQESGIQTFRGSDGLWEGHSIEEVATTEAFDRNPKLVLEFYNQRRQKMLSPKIKPNPAHEALAKMEKNWEGSWLLVTQNVDNLHEQAGSQNIIHMHGELLKARCLDSGQVFGWQGDLTLETPHPNDPKRLGRLRPHIVWFGEMPLQMDIIYRHLRQCDLFLAIGTSGVVYPAAQFVQAVPTHCHRVEFNLDETPVSPFFDETLRGPASQIVPLFVRTLIGSIHL